MNAISRALKKGDSQPTQLPAGPKTTSPKRKRGHAGIDPPDATTVAKQHLSARDGGDIDLGMLDEEAFARVIASSGQQDAQGAVIPSQVPRVIEEEEEEAPVTMEDLTYRPSEIVGEGADPVWRMRMVCLPVLDIFSTEILRILSSHQHSAILQIVTGAPASPLSQNYMALLNLFDATKKQIYSEGDFQAFLDPDFLGFREMQERKVIRKANVATFISSVFGSVDVGFFHLNEGFLSTMAPDGGRLLKEMSKLFLDLKTQAYISAMGQPSRDQTAILNDLFPSAQQLTQMFVARRSLPDVDPANATQEDLTPSELEFITKCERRREHLRSLGDTDQQVQELKETYSWESFLRELRGYISKNWEIIVASKGGKPRRTLKKKTTTPSATAFPEGPSISFSTPAPPPVSQPSTTPVQNIGVPTSLSPTTTQSISEAYEKAKSVASATFTPNVGPAGSTIAIPPPQTPATTKPAAEGTSRGAAAETGQVRRPWTKEEENALFEGLEAVQGPNWAAILQLYGPGGSVSEALKDRSQVQLKDKARNLKLFFLKGGHPMPVVLQNVTGKLKGGATSGEDTPKRRKKRRTGDGGSEEQQGTKADFAEGGWTQTAQSGQNVDPGLH